MVTFQFSYGLFVVETESFSGLFKETKIWCIIHDLMNNYVRKQVFFNLLEMLKEARWILKVVLKFWCFLYFRLTKLQMLNLKYFLGSPPAPPPLFSPKLFVVLNLNQSNPWTSRSPNKQVYSEIDLVYCCRTPFLPESVYYFSSKTDRLDSRKGIKFSVLVNFAFLELLWRTVSILGCRLKKIKIEQNRYGNIIACVLLMILDK